MYMLRGVYEVRSTCRTYIASVPRYLGERVFNKQFPRSWTYIPRDGRIRNYDYYAVHDGKDTGYIIRFILFTT